MGGKVVQRYRLYQKTLGSGDEAVKSANPDA